MGFRYGTLRFHKLQGPVNVHALRDQVGGNRPSAPGNSCVACNTDALSIVNHSEIVSTMNCSISHDHGTASSTATWTCSLLSGVRLRRSTWYASSGRLLATRRSVINRLGIISSMVIYVICCDITPLCTCDYP